MGSPLASESFKKLQCAYEVSVYFVWSWYTVLLRQPWFKFLAKKKKTLTVTRILWLMFVFSFNISRFFLILQRSEIMMNNLEKKNIRVLHRNLLIFHIRYNVYFDFCYFCNWAYILTCISSSREPYENQSGEIQQLLLYLAIVPDWNSLTIF